MNASLATVLVIACLAAAGVIRADIIAKEFVEPVTGTVTSGYVFQGSRKMKRLGKADRNPVEPLVLWEVANALSTNTSGSGTSSNANVPRPRFGFGSDFRPEREDAPVEPEAAPVFPELVPVYQAVPRVWYAPWYSSVFRVPFRSGYPVFSRGPRTVYFNGGPVFGYPFCR